MKVAVLVYYPTEDEVKAALAWVDPFAGRVLHLLSVPMSPNLGVFPEYNSTLVSYTEYSEGSPAKDWLDVYRLSDWTLQGRLLMDCRAHFNICPQWTTFLPSPDNKLIYVYKANTLGHHWADDFVCGLDLTALAFTPWNFRIPECVAGWSISGGRAHTQMLFVADGLEVGKLPSADFEQKVAYWLGPDEGMGPIIPIGPRPRAHSDLGHARSILFAPNRPLSVVVCTDGVVHLIDPVDFRYLERQQVEFTDGYAMPIFAAQVDRQARFIYVGTATDEARHQGLVERIVVHDLDRGQWQNEWLLEEPLGHMALTTDGEHICGASPQFNKLWIFDASTGQIEAVMQLDGSPQYVIPII